MAGVQQQTQGTASADSTAVTEMLKSKPALRDLNAQVVPYFADKWEQLAEQLLKDEYQRQIDVVRANHNTDVSNTCRDMFNQWLQCTVDAKWTDVLKALRTPGVDLEKLATSVEQSISDTSSRPKLKELSSLVVPGAAYVWEELGGQLFNKDHRARINTIAANYTKNAKKCLADIMNFWLQTDPGATWDDILKAAMSAAVALPQKAAVLQKWIETGAEKAENGVPN